MLDELERVGTWLNCTYPARCYKCIQRNCVTHKSLGLLFSFQRATKRLIGAGGQLLLHSSDTRQALILG
jgi:hypothetical protein